MEWKSPRTLLPGVPLVVRVPLNSAPNWIATLKNTGPSDIEAVSYKRVGLTIEGPAIVVANTAETPIPLVPTVSMTFRGLGEALTSALFTLTSAGGTTVVFEVNAP